MNKFWSRLVIILPRWQHQSPLFPIYFLEILVYNSYYGHQKYWKTTPEIIKFYFSSTSWGKILVE